MSRGGHAVGEFLRRVSLPARAAKIIVMMTELPRPPAKSAEG